VDKFSAETRSKVMARVRSQRNLSTEWRLRAILVRTGIRGWKLNPADVPGRPDFVFREERVALFVDGCYWHGCPTCYRRPSSNTAYWDSKIQRNRVRDAKISTQLRRDGWRVLRVWEHQLSDMEFVLRRVRSTLKPGCRIERHAKRYPD
jgi:DNA mismatch endonuclease (patch repair protein)